MFILKVFIWWLEFSSLTVPANYYVNHHWFNKLKKKKLMNGSASTIDDIWTASKNNNAFFPPLQTKYELIRSVIFYSGALSAKRGTHLSLISPVSHVMWDLSEREREPLWLPATQLFAAVQCHCHSLAVLMCSFLSTSITITLGRRACKWKSV